MDEYTADTYAGEEFPMTLTRRGRVLAVASVAVVALIAAAFVWVYEPTRTEIRWLLFSGEYKGRVMAEPAPPSGELRHAEWDMSGMVGMETAMYLVYDPADSLAAAASSGEAGKFTGIPCKVPKVKRMEPGWYLVTAYTAQYWGVCGS
jgi:hypothetical protein